MTAPERIYIDRGPRGGWMHRHERMPDTQHEYILHTRAALAASPVVQEIVAEAVRAEREACAEVADMIADWHSEGAADAINPTQKHGNELMQRACASCAVAIRARGEG